MRPSAQPLLDLGASQRDSSRVLLASQLRGIPVGDALVSGSKVAEVRVEASDEEPNKQQPARVVLPPLYIAYLALSHIGSTGSLDLLEISLFPKCPQSSAKTCQLGRRGVVAGSGHGSTLPVRSFLHL